MSKSIINRGSDWRKWDLHIHTPYSYLENKFPKGQTESGGKIPDEQIDKYINKITEMGIEAIGLTNYFRFHDEEYKLKKKIEKMGIAVFLNLEVRLPYFNQENNLFNYHIIFDNNLDESVIKNFINGLDVSVGESPKTANMLTVDEIRHTANVDFTKLIEILERKSLGLKGNHLRGFMTRGHGNARNNNQPRCIAVTNDVVRQSHFLIHSSEDSEVGQKNLATDRAYWLSHEKYVRPLLQSSDAHKLDDIGVKYSWIKADLTFEGLRQILFEPADRVSLIKEKPEKKLDYQVIDYFEYGDAKLYFNSNLNTIIGGRSNGKSTLLNSIAKKLKKDTGNAFVFDNYENMRIIWQDNSEKDSRDIEYIHQDYMFELANEDTKRDELVHSIIQEKGLDGKIKEYDELVKSNSSEITEKVNDYFLFEKKIKELQKPEGDKEGIENQISKFEDERAALIANSGITEYENKLYLEKVDELEQLGKKEISILKSLEELNTIKNFDLIRSDIEINHLNDDIKNPLLAFIDNIKIEVDTRWLDEVLKIEKAYQIEREKLEQNVLNIKSSDVYLNGKKRIEQNEALENIEQLLKSQKEKLTAFIQYEDELEDLKYDKAIREKQILYLFSNYEKYRNKLIDEFDLQEDDLTIKLDFNSINFEDKINFLNARYQNNNKFIESFDNNSSAVISRVFERDLSFTQKKSQEDLIRAVFNTEWYSYHFELYYQNDEYKAMSQGKKAFVILKLILEFSEARKPVLIDQPEDSLDNRAIYTELTTYLKNKKSQRQIILVTHNPNVVIGADAENIIVANQHSMETPNASDSKFSYVNGGIESTKERDELNPVFLERQGIREHVFDILEGGLEAFEKRENKYNLKGGFGNEV